MFALLSSSPKSYQDALHKFQQAALDGIHSSQYQPFVYPYRALGPNLLILYLLLPPTKSILVYYVRYPLFLFIICHAIDGILHCRSPMVTVGYGIGLLNAWAILWSATLIIINDARSQFKRIEGVTARVDEGEQDSNHANGHAEPAGATIPMERESRKGTIKQRNSEPTLSKRPPMQNFYYWQVLPQSFLHRLDWVADLVSSFRGPRWDHAISGITPPPLSIQRSLKNRNFPPPTPYSNITRSQLLAQNLPKLLLCVLALDLLKTITMQDPYFWAQGPSSPSPFPVPRLTRLLLSVSFTYISLQSIFLLSPLVYACLLGPERIGQHAWPWLYTPYFGSARSVFKNGLAGAWGQWWQQLFRFGFEQAGEAATRWLGGKGREKEMKSKKSAVFRVFVAFACSGALHACASYASLGSTKPLRGSFGFFMVQPVGIVGQRVVTGWVRKVGVREKVPAWVRETGNAVFVVVWFWLTGPLIADEFAATGIWLYEPIGLSLFRGLRGEGWWWWGGTWVRWHRAEKWWQSGLAF